MEVLRLRMQDLDGERRPITVRSGKGEKKRLTLMRGHREDIRALHLRTWRARVVPKEPITFGTLGGTARA
jgi:site-specific recombinase XerD